MREVWHIAFGKDVQLVEFAGTPMDDEDDHNARAAAARRGSPFLNMDQAAHYLGISRRTLDELLEHGDGPPFRKHGRQNRFHITDLDAWSASNKHIGPRNSSRDPQS